MSTKFVTNAAIALLGGVVVVLSMGLASTTAVGWSAFGIAIGVVAVSVLAQLDGHRGMAQRALDGAFVAVAGTLIATSIVFTGTVLTWLSFALALGIVAVAFTGLTLHEAESWRSAHGLGQLHGLGRAHREEPPVELGRVA